MFSAMQISESAQGLVLSYPLWAGVGFLVAAAAFIAYSRTARARAHRRWPISVAIAIAAWAGLYFVTFRATITDEAASVYAFSRYDHSVRWKDAADFYLEQRAGADSRIVVLDRQRRSFHFDVADLSLEDRDRVMAYITERMPESAVRRAPALLKRQAPHSARPAGLLGDQQI